MLAAAAILLYDGVSSGRRGAERASKRPRGLFIHALLIALFVGNDHASKPMRGAWISLRCSQGSGKKTNTSSAVAHKLFDLQTLEHFSESGSVMTHDRKRSHTDGRTLLCTRKKTIARALGPSFHASINIYRGELFGALQVL